MIEVPFLIPPRVVGDAIEIADDEVLRIPDESILNPDPTLTPPRTVADAVGKSTLAIPVLLSIANQEPILIPPNIVPEATGID